MAPARYFPSRSGWHAEADPAWAPCSGAEGEQQGAFRESLRGRIGRATCSGDGRRKRGDLGSPRFGTCEGTGGNVFTKWGPRDRGRFGDGGMEKRVRLSGGQLSGISQVRVLGGRWGKQGGGGIVGRVL